MLTKKIGIIGCGVMGSIFAEAWVQKNIISPEHLFLYDRFAEKQQQLGKQLGVPEKNLGADWISQVAILLLAVKPQDFVALAETIKTSLHPSCRIYSLMAGITTTTLIELLGTRDIVRFMPNTPASIGEGVLGCFIPDENAEKKGEVTKLLSVVGKVISLPEESMIHSITAISGSGPAWVYYFLRSLTAAAESLGFSSEDAREIVLQTVKGAVALAATSPLSFDEQIARVASKGGTTEAGLKALDGNEAGSVLSSAVEVAFRRSKEMAGE